ncbi:hypothetical protein SPURM210S_01669 [Streptomyces purpurascens]
MPREREPGQRTRAGVPGGRVTGQRLRERVGLLERRGGEAVEHTVVLGAVADRVDVRVGGAQLVVDDDTLADVESGGLRETHPGADTAGDDHQVGVERVPVGHLHRADRAADAAHVPYAALGVHFHAQVGQVPLDELGGGRVELALHEPLGLLGEHDLGAAQGERPGRGDPEEPAADDDRTCSRPDRLGQSQAVVHGPEGVHALGQLVVLGEQPAQRRQYGVGTGGQHQPVVCDHRTVRARDGPPVAVDAGDPAAGQLRGRGQGDHLGAVPSGQHFGEQHPVVGPVLLLADQQRGRAELTEPPGEPYAREAGADHHHTLIRGHVLERAVPVLPGSITSVSHGERCPQRGRGPDVRVPEVR